MISKKIKELLDIELEELQQHVPSLAKDNISSIYELTGDASDRKYIRIILSQQDPIIVMKMSSPFTGQELPFINIQKHLTSCKINVPIIYGYIQNKGLLFLEDLGDISFHNKVDAKEEDVQLNFYMQAIDILIDMQTVATDAKTGDCIALSYCFDVATFMKELNFFMDNMIKGVLKTEVVDREILHDSFEKICNFLTKQDYCFTHRDYHSRNIMVKNNKLKIIDFQDARLGPCQYDLVSLLKDSYIALDDNLTEKLITYYIAEKEEIQGKKIDYEAFIKAFDYMSIQRNLKAIGTFAFQKVGKGNSRYLKYIPQTLSYVKSNLEKYPELNNLKEALFRNPVFE